MSQFATVKPIPYYFKMTNPVSTSGDLKQDSSCQPSFTYYPQSRQGQVGWGSNRPMNETCPSPLKPHSGNPTHAIWNNLTKRKSIVLN